MKTQQNTLVILIAVSIFLCGSVSRILGSDIYSFPADFSASRSFYFAEGKGFKGNVYRSGNLIRIENEMGGGFIIMNLSDKTVNVVNDAQRLVMKYKFESSPTTAKVIDDGFLLFGIPVAVESVLQDGSYDKYSLGGEYKNYTLSVSRETKLPVSLVRVDDNGFWTSLVWDDIKTGKPDSSLFNIPDDYSVMER